CSLEDSLYGVSPETAAGCLPALYVGTVASAERNGECVVACVIACLISFAAEKLLWRFLRSVFFRGDAFNRESGVCVDEVDEWDEECEENKWNEFRGGHPKDAGCEDGWYGPGNQVNTHGAGGFCCSCEVQWGQTHLLIRGQECSGRQQN